VIEFKLDGAILAANENFLATLGYRLDDCEGPPTIACSSIRPMPPRPNIREFLGVAAPRRFQSAEYKRIGGRWKDRVGPGQPITRSATRDGKPVKVVKFATDITRRQAEVDGRRRPARSDQPQPRRSSSSSSTAPSSNANEKLPSTPWATGWTTSRAATTACSSNRPTASRRKYAHFWDSAAPAANSRRPKYKRIGAGGKTVWVQASYNPIRERGRQGR